MKSLYYLVLALSLLFASCDSPTDTKKNSSSSGENNKGAGGAGEAKKPDGAGGAGEAKKPDDAGAGGAKPPTGEAKKPDGADGAGADDAETAGITLRYAEDPEPMTFGEGKTYKHLLTSLEKIKLDAGGTGDKDKGEITYVSSHEDVATVDKKGKATFLKAGTTEITATKARTPGKYKASTTKYTLTIVLAPGAQLSFATPTPSVVFKVGGTFEQEVTKTNIAGDTGTVTYESGSPDVAGVNANTGVVTPLSGGTTVITARKAATEGKFLAHSATYELTVTAGPGAQLSFTDNRMSGELQAPFNRSFPGQITTKTDVADDTGTVTYESGSPDVAEVNANTGAVTPLSVGTTVITARKGATAKYREDTTTYTFEVTKYTPADKDALVAEIQEATKPEAEGGRGMNADLNYIDTSGITTMSLLFAADDPGTPKKTEGYGLETFNGDISGWNVSLVTNMYRMFWGATAFNNNISGWQVDNVTRMISMFHGATAFTQNLDAWQRRLNDEIKANSWKRAENMFTNSGLTSLPNWCETVKACKDRQK